MLRSLLALLLAAGLVSCRAESRTDSEAVRRTIESNNAKAEAWYAAGQIDSLATIFAEDARQMPPNMAPIVGRDSIKAFWTNALKWGKWEFDFNTADVVAADSLAVERGTFTLKFTAGPQAPFPSFQDRGNYVVLWRWESDGVWRAVWDAPVSTMPIPGTPAAAPEPASTRR